MSTQGSHWLDCFVLKQGRRKSVALSACFNPLPSPKQGETPVSKMDGAAIVKFQSAPLTEARGDTISK